MTAVSRRAAVAAALAAAGRTGVSGEALARQLGISRVAVGKHITGLKNLGYEIESLLGVGYRLVSAPDACIPEEVAPRLRDALWIAVEGGLETGSTNDDAKRLARAGAAEGTVVVAGRQTGGRGRFGRVWVSPPGGVYVSALLRPTLPPGALGPFALVVSLAVARALGRFGVEAGLKWPNDVVIGDAKVAGVLMEMAAEADTVEWLVVGCGINVITPAHEGAASVRGVAPGASVPDVAAAVLDEIAGAYRRFLTDGFDVFAAEYRSRGTLWGREVTVRDAYVATVASGIAETIDGTGALVVRDTTGTHTVVSGEVTLAG